MSENSNGADKNTRSWPVVLAFMALIGVPVIFKGAEPEVERWQAAVAFNQYEQGDKVEAVNGLRQILGADSSNSFLRIRLAQWLSETRQPQEALAVVDQELERMERIAATRDGEISKSQLWAHQLKAQILLTLGRNREGLNVMKQLETNFDNETTLSVDWINRISYFRALSGRELPQARQDMEQVFQTRGLNIIGGLGSGFSYRMIGLVATSELALLVEDTEEIHRLLSEEIELMELEREERAQKSNGIVDHLFTEPFFYNPLFSFDGEVFDAKDRDRELAILYLMRGLILEHEGNVEASGQDRIRIHELGSAEADLLNGLPDEQVAFAFANEAAALMDTMGWIRFRQRALSDALDQMNLAVAAAELVLKAGDDKRFMLAATGMDYREIKRERIRSLATLRKHRYTILKGMGQHQQAAEDLARLQSLGFELDEPQLQ